MSCRYVINWLYFLHLGNLCCLDIARGLLDLAVDGPEGVSIWAAYQIELDSETDDEEREARLMDDDMQS